MSARRRDASAKPISGSNFSAIACSGLAVAEMLYEAFPEADEGELSRRLAGLVRKESCAEVALAWGIETHVRLGESEKQAGAANMAILGDVCESIIGAVFLDAGYDAAKAVVAAAFGARMLSPERPLRDPKTLLQEWAQARGLPAPHYRETARSGPDHAPEFTISVEVPGYRECRGERFCQARSPSKPRRRRSSPARASARRGAQAPPKGRRMNGAAMPGTRCGFVALIGAPNAGKSTLINQLVGTKVSIVSRKVQTTRGTVRGIAIEGAAQIIYVDTPGNIRAETPARPGHGRRRLGQRGRRRRRRFAHRCP